MLPNPAPKPAAASTSGLTETMLTACGFALGFGWLWFPLLAAHWLPAFLWGRPFAGGGSSLFISLVAGGFLLYWVLSGLRASQPSPAPLQAPPAQPIPASPDKPERKPGPPAGVWPHLAHALALMVVGLEISAHFMTWTLRPGLRVAALALAGLTMGIFWGGRLLSLPPPKAGWALVAAGAIGLGLALGLSRCPLSQPGSCLALPLVLAWLAAWQLDRLKRPRPEPKRLRGRPSKKNNQPETREPGPVPE